jgi:hypothetical protein
MQLVLHQVHTAGKLLLAVINDSRNLSQIQAGRKGRG